MSGSRACSWSGSSRARLEWLTAADVSGFLARECPRRSVSGARELVAGLRPLLRYLHVAGLIGTPLVWAVPGVADLRDRSLPRGVEPQVVSRPAGQLRPAADGRTAGLRDLVAAGPARVARRRGRRDAARGSRLAGGRDHRAREARPAGQAAVAGRCRPGAGLVSAASRPERVPGGVLADARARRARSPASGCAAWFTTRAFALGYRRSARTSSGTPRRRRCSGQGASLRGDRAGAAPPGDQDHRDQYAKVDRTRLRPLAMPWPGGAS